MIEQIVLDECDSTQKFLKNHLKDSNKLKNIIVSTHKQMSGYGRRGRVWHHTPGSLACSFSLAPHRELTLTTLELGVILVNYFKNKDKNIFLKWPNDLCTADHKKIGGIIIDCHFDYLLVGVGINLINHPETTESGNMADSLGLTHDSIQLGNSLYEYVLNHRILKAADVLKSWNLSCSHVNSKVSIEDGDQKNEGIFLGVGQKGEAILQDLKEEKKRTFFSGTLRLIN